MKRRSNLLIVLLFAIVGALIGMGFMIHQNTRKTTEDMETASNRAENAKSAYEQAQEEADRLAAQEASESESAREKAESEKESAAKAESERAESEKESAEKAAETETEEATEAQTEAVTELETETETETEKPFNAAENLQMLLGEDMSELAEESPLPEHHVIFVGDSRTVGMGNAEADLFDRCNYIGESGEGLRWFKDEGYYRMAKVIDMCPEDPVVINLGVNDMSEISKYLDLYATFEDDFPDTEFYFMSVNPVTDEAASVTNEEIREFNRELKAAYGDHYLDVNRIMTKDGFRSVDGVHYSEDTYRDIHDYVVRALYSED